MNIAQAIIASRDIGRISYERYVELYHADVGPFYPPWDSLSESARQRWVSVASAAVDAFMKKCSCSKGDTNTPSTTHRPAFMNGDRVRLVVAGPLRNQTGLVTDIRGNMVCVRLESGSIAVMFPGQLTHE